MQNKSVEFRAVHFHFEELAGAEFRGSLCTGVTLILPTHVTLTLPACITLTLPTRVTLTLPTRVTFT